MKPSKRAVIAIAILCFLLLSTNVLAMSSTHYRLDWFTPGTSGGGGAMHSTHYAVNVTVGQTAVGHSASTHYAAGLGFWYGMLDWLRLYLPLIRR